MQGQGQGSRPNSFPRNLYFNGVNGSDQHNVIPNASAYGGHNSMGRVGQSSSNHDIQSHIGFAQFIGDDFWLSPTGVRAATTSQRFEESPLLQNIRTMNSSIINPFLENISMRNHDTGHVNSDRLGPIGPSSLLSGQEAGSNPRQNNLDLNAIVHESSGNGGSGNGGTGSSQDNGPYLTLDLFRGGAAAGDRIPTSCDSSSPVMIYSGIAGYVLEENINREGLPADGQRRLLCKRRAPEFAYGESSSSTRQAGNSSAQRGPTFQNIMNNNINASHNHLNSSYSEGAKAALPTPSNFHRVSNDQLGQAESFQRNTRLRISSASQQNPRPANLWTWNSRNSSFQATGQPSGLSPFAQFTIASSAAAPVLVNPTMQPIGQVPNSLQAPQSSQYWNGTTMSGISSSIFPDHQTVNGREAMGQEDYLRSNNRRNMMNPLSNIQADLNFANGNANFLGNIASSSRIQPMHPISSSLRSLQNMAQYAQRMQDIIDRADASRHLENYCPIPHGASLQNMAQYAQRMQDIIDRADASRHLENYCPIPHGASPAVRNMDVSERGGNARPAQVSLRIGSRSERQVGHPSEVSPAVLSQIAAQRRSRLVSEVRNALGLVRRPGGLQFEDVMVIDRSFLYGLPGMPDIHDGMRLDVDNMSYEELLALGERIGNVSTGLSEESVLANLRRRKYQTLTIGSPAEAEPCCICQEEYANGEELGKLDCGHDFHFNCIKQWLFQKNSCPICKKTALAI